MPSLSKKTRPRRKQTRRRKDERSEHHNLEEKGDKSAGGLVLEPAKQKLSTSSDFRTSVDLLYSQARENSNALAKRGSSHIIEAKSKIKALRSQQLPYASYLDNYKVLCMSQEKSFVEHLQNYNTILSDLGTQRANSIDAASSALKSEGVQRQQVLKTFTKSARKRVENFRQEEKTATDASALIRHYKNLLRD